MRWVLLQVLLTRSRREDPPGSETWHAGSWDFPSATATGSGGETITAQPLVGEDVTSLLRRWRRGEGDALGQLLPLVYDDLRRLAQHLMAGERGDHTLQATALVHEAFLELSRRRWPDWQGRRHFLNAMARLMRRLLVDYARARACAKRGGSGPRVPLEAAVEVADPEVREERVLADLLALDVALDRLAAVDARKARTLELRLFVGLSLEETAEHLGVSAATVNLDTRLGKAWLARELGAGVSPGS